MASHREEENEANTIETRSITQYSGSEDIDDDEEGDEDQNWDDWEDDAVEEVSESNLGLLCMFCDSRYDSCASIFEHCTSAHGFDFYQIKKALNLDFYKCFKLINYIRAQVSKNKSWIFEIPFQSQEGLQNHGAKAVNFDENIFPWDDDKYLNPFLEDDALLYSFDGENEDEDEDITPVDTKELTKYLSQFEISDQDETSHVIPCQNGIKEATFTSEKFVNTEKRMERLITNGGSNSTLVITNQIKKIDKSYFGGYSSFGIHKDMISDKVRTDAYRQAIVENPSLLRNAVVMDVGCGTGILSLFAAQAGASRVISVEASDKMASVATQIAKDNGLLRNDQPNGVIEVIQGMVEDLDQIPPHSVDVLLSEWMGYCLLYESMLTSVLLARDRWLKPGGAILPDTATMLVAGFGKGGTSLPFWENVYGFNMACIGQEVVEDAARIPIVDVIDSGNIVTTTEVLQTFDLVTMQPNEMDFTVEIELKPKLITPSNNPQSSEFETTWCYGLVLWFDTGFTKRFCRDKPANVSTSPYQPNTHWSQTILTFREPIAMVSNVSKGEKLGPVGTVDCPAVTLKSRISVVRGEKHRTIDISMELTGIGSEGQKRNWPAQIFNLE